MDKELRLWAINVDLFRKCFAAPPELAQTLREVTNTVTPAVPKKRVGGLLSVLGPLMRTPLNAPVIRPGIPNNVDAEAMMTSRYIAADRLSACWTLARSWLDHLALAQISLPLPVSQLEELEFDLVRAGVSTQLSIRRLWLHSIDIPLRPIDPMTIGFMDHATVLRLVDEWTNALPEFEEGTVEFATQVLEFAKAYPQYADQASTTGSPPPDLIAWWTAR
ncbi:MAG: hypothetical protein LBG99_08875 [Propionibacteriaceae bacterium]|jgi:hypothetical protein|nr:hypothetical protein [Propionibacteriaceae bacterium]